MIAIDLCGTMGAVPAPVPHRRRPVRGPPRAVTRSTTVSLEAEQAEALAHRLKAIADPARLRVLSLLLRAEGGEACTCDLVDALGSASRP